ncbi:MAG TPA: diacylglycerol kinase family protein [Ktedonobacteraceae bacterium]|jgi:diacylglycerol kinase family enzyme|nr:diacylglycerol kinase family protein [Ktedonobacteraceae bacterium]
MNEKRMPGARKAIVIHSPHSGRASQLGEALTHLQDLGIEVAQNISIAELDNLPAQGDHWKELGLDFAIAAGGDGLIGGVITHIAESGLPLGILPLGTSNDIARSLRIPLDLFQAAKVIAQGNLGNVDVGIAWPAEQAPHKASKRGISHANIPPKKHGYFAHALTVGLNVQFARIATNIATRSRYGRLTYPVAAIEVLKDHEVLDVHLEFQGLSFPRAQKTDHPIVISGFAGEEYALDCRAIQIAIINAPIFGGQLGLSVPNASISDRLLDIVVIEELELGRLGQILGRFFGAHNAHSAEEDLPPETNGTKHHAGELTGLPGIHHIQAKGVIISTDHDPRDVTLDGEVRGQTPIYVHLADARLRIIVPE